MTVESSTYDSSGSYQQIDGNSDSFTGNIPILAPSEMGVKKLSYTVTLHLQTTSFIPGMRKLLDMVGEKGGYIEYANVTGYDLRYPPVERAADFRFRVPSEQLGEFLVEIENNYNLWYLLQETADDTARYQLDDTRLDDLREQERRLLDDLKKTYDAKERLNIESRLSEVQSSIRRLSASQASIENNVVLSTVNIKLFEVIITDPESVVTVPFVENLRGVASNSIDTFINILQGLVIAIVVLSPFIIIVAVVGGIVLLVNRMIKKRKRERAGNKKVENAQSEYNISNEPSELKLPNETGEPSELKLPSETGEASELKLPSETGEPGEPKNK